MLRISNYQSQTYFRIEKDKQQIEVTFNRSCQHVLTDFKSVVDLIRDNFIIKSEQSKGIYLDRINKLVAAVLFGMLLMLKVTSLLRKGDEVREDHATKADMIERCDRVGQDVFGMVIIQWSLNKISRVARCHHRLHMRRHVFHFHSLDLAEKLPHRHFQIEREREKDRSNLRNPNP